MNQELWLGVGSRGRKRKRSETGAWAWARGLTDPVNLRRLPLGGAVCRYVSTRLPRPQHSLQLRPAALGSWPKSSKYSRFCRTVSSRSYLWP